MVRKITRKAKTKKKKGAAMKTKRSGYTFTISASDRKILNATLLGLQKNLNNTMKSFEKTLAVMAKW